MRREEKSAPSACSPVASLFSECESVGRNVDVSVSPMDLLDVGDPELLSSNGLRSSCSCWDAIVRVKIDAEIL